MYLEIFVYTLLTLLAGLGFWISKRSGGKIAGIVLASFSIVILLWTLLGDLDFLVLFIWPALFSIQLVFICYWSFRLFKRKKLAVISSILLSLTLVLLAMEPWISDWTFSRNDARELLATQGVELKDDFSILKNTSGGLRDYYHDLKLEISNADKERLMNEIRLSKNFQPEFEDTYFYHWDELPPFDTANFETKDYVIREFYTEESQDFGTHHFYIRLSKERPELLFIASDE